MAAVSSGAHHGGHVSSSISATVHAPSTVPAASYGGGVMGISATGNTTGITLVTVAKVPKQNVTYNKALQNT